MQRSSLLVLAAAALAVATGCGQKPSLMGAVYVAGSVYMSGDAFAGGNGVPGVKITIGGAEQGAANEQGFFFITDVPTGDRVSVCFSAPGYVTRCRNVTIRGGQAVRLSPTELYPAAPAQTVTSAGGTVSTGNAQAVLAAGTICKQDRSTVVSGNISCSVTPLNVSTLDDRERAPGSYLGQDNTGATVSLETGGMLDVTCTEIATGEEVDVCTGKSATVRLAIFANCQNELIYPATMASWGFNEETGLWEEESNFTKTCLDAATGYYEGAATHFSYWNADRVIETTCARGKVADPTGRAVDGARIMCSGVDYQGSSEAYSDASGDFCAPVKAGGQYSCVAAKGGFASTPKTGTAPAAAATCGSSSCADLGTLSLKDPVVMSVLTWGQNPSDLDSHVHGPNGVHISYSNRGDLAATPYILLDTDDTTSFGPEIVTFMPSAASGVYRYCIHNYSGESDPDDHLATSDAEVNLLAGSEQRSYRPPGSNPSAHEYWRVYEVTLGSGGQTSIRDLNQYAETCED